jgi:hypothetical protein
VRAIHCLIAVVLIAAGAPAASWKEYPQPQLGFVVEFPADPTTSTGTYKTGLVTSASAQNFSVKEEHAIYIATVVDLPDRKEEGATLLGEAESFFTQLGDVTSISASRVEPGRAAIYGRFMTIACRAGKATDLIGQTPQSIQAWFKNMTGVECPNGARLMGNLFFNRGRLYMIQGMNLPNKDDGAGSPSAVRFSTSVSFFAADGSRNFADTFK